jgi:hypothetical protein
LQDYYNQLAQSRAGKSSKSKLLIAKFKSAKSVKGWEVRQGSYFQDIYPSTSRFEGGTDASFEFAESGQAVFSGITLRNVHSTQPFDLFNSLLKYSILRVCFHKGWVR